MISVESPFVEMVYSRIQNVYREYTKKKKPYRFGMQSILCFNDNKKLHWVDSLLEMHALKGFREFEI